MMANNDPNNDEYHFADLEESNPDHVDETTNFDPETVPEEKSSFALNHTKRNAIVVIAVIVILLGVYKFGSAIFSKKKVVEKPQIATLNPVPAFKPVVQPQPLPAPPPQPTPAAEQQVEQKLASLEVSQQTITSNLGSVSNQVGSLNQNVTNLAAKVAELNGVIANLNEKLAEQSQQIQQMTIKVRPVVRPHVYPKKSKHGNYYFIQAIIPGRAWLMNTNGSTLTVREGTIIHGYGMVKLIDAEQGRVVMSSGQIIRFSQADS